MTLRFHSGQANDQLDKGFTLVELIIVIAIIAILAGAIFVAIDPARRLHEARNARRWSDVNTIVNAIKQYQVDNEGEHYYEVEDAYEDEYSVLGEDALLCSYECVAVPMVSNDCVDLTDIGTEYLAVVPADPKTGDQEYTGYYLYKDSNGAITIGACDAEGEGAGGSGAVPVISVTR